MTNTMQNSKELNFSYDFISQNPDSKEARIQERVKNNLIVQNSLVDLLFSKEILQWDELQNAYETEEGQEEELKEIFTWYAFAADSLDIAHLQASDIPFISNEYGTWIGREDCGSAWDLYFLPFLCDALYNTAI